MFVELGRTRRDVDGPRERLRAEIFAARMAGSSLRAIADVVGLAPESVRTIVAEEKARRDPERFS